MCKRFWPCILGIGALLLVAAVALVVQTQSASSHTRAYQVLHVAEAINRVQDNCGDCHDVDDDANLLALTTSELARRSPFDPDGDGDIDAPSAQQITAANLLQQSVDTQLVDLGQRIQALPAVAQPRQDVVVNAFLETVSATRTIAAARDLYAANQMAERAQWRIDALDALLRDLENAASPFKWAAQASASLQPHAAAVTVSPVSPVTVILHADAAVSAPVWTGWTVTDTAQLEMPQEIVYATHRRGPPAAGLSLDSVGSGRLLSRDMQSPFLFGDRNNARAL